MSLVWINGQLADKAEARISIFDHGFLYGDGVWEQFRAFSGKLFRPEKSLARLFANPLGIAIPLSLAELHAAIDATLLANGRTEGYVRVIVTRGAGTLGPDPRKIDPQIFIIAEEYHPFPTELYEHGLNVVWARLPEPSLRQMLGDRSRVQAKRVALAAGCFDAILLDPHECVVGLTEGDLYLVKDGAIRTFADDPLCDAIRTDRRLTIQDVSEAEEVFLAGISGGVIAIVKTEDRIVGLGREGPITKRIRDAYRRLTRGEA